MNPWGCTCPCWILTVRVVRGWCLLLRCSFTSIQCINHFFLVIIVLKVEVKRSVGKLVFYYLLSMLETKNGKRRISKWRSRRGMIDYLLDEWLIVLPLQRCSPTRLEMTLNSNLSHLNLFDCLLGSGNNDTGTFIKQSQKSFSRKQTSRVLFCSKWINWPIKVWGVLSEVERYQVLKYRFFLLGY